MTIPGPVPGRDRHGDPVLVGFVVLGVLVTVGYGFQLGGPLAQLTAGWLVLIVVQVAVVLWSLSVSSIAGVSTAFRRFWRSMAVAFGLFGIGNVVELVRAIAAPTVAADGPSVARVVSIGLGALVLLVALLTSPLILPSARERQRFWMDAATVMVAMMIFVWTFAGPTAHDLSSPDRGLVGGMLIPAAFAVMGFGMIKLTLGGSAPFTVPVTVLGSVAAVLAGLSTGFGHLLVATGHLPWEIGLNVLANTLAAVAAYVQGRQLRADPALLRPGRRPPFSKLPYVAVAATYGLLVWQLQQVQLTVQTWAVLVAAILSTTLVMARQLAAFADNAELLRSLDAKVRELDEAHEAMGQALGERDLLAEKLRYQAYHDSLTGLANRALFQDCFDQALERSGRSGELVAIMMIDLDKFKAVNDRFGHAAGDLLLQQVAQRLVGCVRPVDTVARLGGDEFAIILEPTPPDLSQLMKRIAAAVERPVRFGDTLLTVGASIGAVVAEPGCDDADKLLVMADARMYTAKAQARTAA